MAELVKKTKPRGAGFTPAEDVGISRAWINASEDAVQCAELKGDDYMRKVHKLYNDTFKPENRETRSIESIRNRVKLLLRNCTSFSACYARVCRQKPFGASEPDLINLATGLFNGVKMTTVTEDCGKLFKFKEAWEVLRMLEKFKAGLATLSPNANDPQSGDAEQEERSGNEDSSKSPHYSVAEDEKRPMGRRRAKEEQRKAHFQHEKLRLAAQTVAAEVEGNHMLKRQLDIMLFTSAPDGCDKNESLDFFKLMRTRALEEARGSLKKPRPGPEQSNDNSISLVEETQPKVSDAVEGSPSP